MKMLSAFLVCTAPCIVVALDNGFTAPPMGWSALYGAPFNTVNETNVRLAAEGLKAGGFLDAGYEYVVLDDWFAVRDETTGVIAGDPTKFPSGMANLSAAVHATGARFGVYSAASQRTCGNWSASLYREAQDAHTFAHEWEIDYLKYDSCLGNNGVASRARYLAMGRALNATGRKIFYSVEGWSGKVAATQGDWGPELANMWRTGSDIWPRWDECILNNLYQTETVAQFMVPGRAWNDPDMLQPPASIGFSTAQPGLSFDESRAQFVLWAVMKAPLMLGAHWSLLASMRTTAPDYFALLTHPEVIAINQDPSPQATLVARAPSAAQQRAGASGVPLTYQVCDARRADQRFVVAGVAGAVRAAGTTLCVTAATVTGSTTILAAPCAAAGAAGAQQQQWPGFVRDARLRALAGSGTGIGCVGVGRDGAPVTAPCVPTAMSLPPPLDDNQAAAQLFVWDSLGGAAGGAIASAKTGMCLTLGRANMPDPAPRPYTNNGTLEHEVWAGPLSSGKRVVILFNKGATAETVSAARSRLGNADDGGASSMRSVWFAHAQGGCTQTGSCPVRDVLARQDMPQLAPGAPLEATVPSHGVRLFVVG